MKKKETLTLNREAKEAFHVLKKAIMMALVLTYPDPNKEYLLETDTSKLGLGVVLSQKQSDSRYHPMAFSSRALQGAEHKYHSTKFEFLAMKWGIHHFEMYLLGRQSKVRADNNPLTYFMSSPNLDATKHHWIDELVLYTFSLEYQKGKNNVVADALSRIGEQWLPQEEMDEILRATPMLEGDPTVVEVYDEQDEDRAPERNPKWTMSKDEMKAIFDNLTMGAGRRTEREWDRESSVAMEADSIEIEAQAARCNTPRHVTDWTQAQREVPELSATLDWCLQDRKKGIPWAQQLEKLKAHLGPLKHQPEGKCIIRNAHKLTLSGGMLYYGHCQKYLEEKKWFIVPRAHRRTALNGCHQDTDHQGKKWTLSLV